MGQAHIRDLANVAAFLAMAEKEDMMLNAVKATEAFESFARLIGVPAGRLRALARDPDVDAIMRKAGAR